MHPRSSFAAFLHVVKTRSLPWEDAEMDAIHSLQLILRGSFQDVESQNDKSLIHARLSDLRIQGMDELSTVANEMVRLIETATAPILAVDANGQVRFGSSQRPSVSESHGRGVFPLDDLN